MLWRVVDQMMDFEQVPIDLLRRLQGVSAVDKQRRTLAQHDRQPGRAGKAGEPGQALAARRHVFALMLVRAWHDEPVEAPRRKLAAQAGEPLGARQSREILAGETVAIAGRHLSAQRFQRFGQGRRHRVGNQRVPARADLLRSAEDTGDQRFDTLGIVGRSRLAQQSCELAPVRGRSIDCHRLLLIPALRMQSETRT